MDNSYYLIINILTSLLMLLASYYFYITGLSCGCSLWDSKLHNHVWSYGFMGFFLGDILCG